MRLAIALAATAGIALAVPAAMADEAVVVPPPAPGVTVGAAPDHERTTIIKREDGPGERTTIIKKEHDDPDRRVIIHEHD